jgi:phosphonate degradation associated HDIG domain protein
MSTLAEIFSLFEQRGSAAYFGEPVSQLEHALQTAYLAEQSAAPPDLIVAALLHDIGHLLHGLPEEIAEQGIDARHELIGAAWLARRFGPEVCQPVKLHVAAKRYLCLVEPDYAVRLSAASVQSLALQGGPFNPDEVQAFERQVHWRAAVQLRRWDEAAKLAGLAVPPLEHYRLVLAATRQ